MKNLLTASAIGAMLVAGVAIATQTDTPTAPKQPLSKAQMLERADARFDRMDANKDGQLSAEERKAGAETARAAMAERAGNKAGGGEMADFMPGARRGGGMGDRMLERADANGDGMISKEENRASVEARFARMDANGDGTIGADERGKGRGKGKGKRARAMAAGESTAAMPGKMKAGHAMKGADNDGDGAVSKAEFDAQSAARFGKLDTNGDGKIDATEMQAQRGKKRGAGGTTPPSPATPQDE